jgi:hypothetical protein
MIWPGQTARNDRVTLKPSMVRNVKGGPAGGGRVLRCGDEGTSRGRWCRRHLSYWPRQLV